jgi:hypothetical protein
LKIALLAGFPRSGTTWISNLINSHPSVAYRHEFLGRCYGQIPVSLFEHLKHNKGLNDDEHHQLVRLLLSATVTADRPPFFAKEHLRFASPQLHHFAWLAARAMPPLAGIYRTLYTPTQQPKVVLVKETRSSHNMDSMISGLRVEQCIFLFRHPCGCIASLERGIESGVMERPNAEGKLALLRCYERQLAQDHGISSHEALLKLPDHCFQAIAWTTQNNDYLDFGERFSSIFLSYENVTATPYESARDVLAALRLDPDDQTEAFLAASREGSPGLLQADSGSDYYSVYRAPGHNPEQWRESLSPQQVQDIETISAHTYARMLDRSQGTQSRDMAN